MAWDAVIVGAGVIGLSIARELALASLRVLLLDRQASGREASWAGAGMLPPAIHGARNSRLAELTRRTHPLWPDLSESLRETTGIDNGFRKCGGLRIDAAMSKTPVSRELALAPQADLTIDEELAAWRAAGARAELAAGASLRSLEPGLSDRFERAVWLPDEWQIRNPRHVKALIADCRRLGVEIREQTAVHALNWRGDRIEGVQTEFGILSGACVVVAAGAWSSSLLPASLAPVEIVPVRGQMVLLSQPRQVLTRVIECGRRYVVPRDDGRVLAGSTEERAGFDKRTNPQTIESLMEFARSIAPQLNGAMMERMWAGLRPHADVEAPFIGPVPGAEGLFLAAGHYRDGLHLSPITGVLMRECVLSNRPHQD